MRSYTSKAARSAGSVVSASALAPTGSRRPARPYVLAPTGQAIETAGMGSYVDGEAMRASFDGLGFERVQHMHGSTYRDSATVIIVPSRVNKFHVRVVQAWQNLIAPMNQKRAFLYVTNDEVGAAYTNTLQAILKDPNLSKWRYVLTLESDNLPPADTHIRLLESIEECGLDAVSGIYFTKGEIQQPMCYGDPFEFQRSGVLDFRPRDIRADLAAGNRVVECNGIAMGCSLYRMDLFRQIEPPWFVTVNDVIEGKGAAAMTQDLFFCEKAKRAGKRFGVDLRVRVGHLDEATGTVY
jgi:hypothetical protein